MPLDASTAITIAGKPVWDEDVRKHFGAGGNNATRLLGCAWADRQLVVELLSGSLTRAGPAAADAPAPYPEALSMVAAGRNRLIARGPPMPAKKLPAVPPARRS